MHATTVIRLAVLLIVMLLPLPAAAGDFTGVVVFGDSLSDPGNHFVAFGTLAQQPFAPIPDDSYAIGGHHFSNGATWAEHVATALGAPRGGSPALRAPGVFTNYAVGRARARAGAAVFADFDLGTQVGRYLTDVGGVAAPGDLYVVEIGANDLQDALTALFTDPSGLTSAVILEEALTAVGGNVYTLWASGARAFLVLDAPDLSVTPAVRALGPVAQFVAAQLTAAYNAGLDDVVSALEPLPGLRILRLDLGAVFAGILAAPETVGVTNVDEPCLSFGVIAQAVCAAPDTYLFWDGIHPTARGHAIIADAALAVIAAE